MHPGTPMKCPTGLAISELCWAGVPNMPSEAAPAPSPTAMEKQCQQQEHDAVRAVGVHQRLPGLTCTASV